LAQSRSFAEYVKDKCYNGLFAAAERYVENNWQSLNLYTKHVRRIGTVELVDASIQRVYVQDLPGMRVAFDVGIDLELTVKEGDYHYDDYDQCYPWIRVSCEGDLSDELDSWIIKRIKPYNPKSAPQDSLSDTLVPYIPYDHLETETKAFLQEHYLETLKITPYNQPPIAIDPTALAKRLTLSIRTQLIWEDGSIFG